MKKHQPRVLIYTDEPPTPIWSCRKSWFIGGESIYSLLAKFAQLNALTNRDICEQFVKPNPLRRPYATYPVVDLRTSGRFYAESIVRTLGISEEEYQTAFVEYKFPNSMQLSSRTLVWCAKCASFGFHSVVFQLNSYITCPVHHTTLQYRCQSCKGVIPYSLNAKSLSLFRCDACNTDLAARMRTHHSTLGTSPQLGNHHREFADLISFLDTLPTLVNACKERLGHPYIPIEISKADLHRRSQTYHQFVTEILASFSTRGLIGDASIRKPTAVFSIAPGPPVLKLRESSRDLEEARFLYRCVRRHITHHFCRGHEKCIRAAQRTLWWDLDGEKILRFCPTAMAFLRWRMHWEGCRIPSMLDNVERLKTYNGLVGWLAGEAPVGSRLWTKQLDSWIKNQLLVYALFDSFAEWQQLNALEKPLVLWDKSIATTFRKRHWACCGRGTQVEPARFYVESSFLEIQFASQTSKSHFRKTRLLLASIRR